MSQQMRDSFAHGMGRPNLEVFAETLLELGQQDRDIVVVTSDSRGSGKLAPFASALPAQLVEVGIAEQNLVGVAAGLAAAGKRVFAVSPACFLTARALEQIKNDVAYSDHPVTLVGISAGVSYGALGSTHHSLHDLAVLRAIHNITVMVPADNAETRQAVRTAANHPHPVYLRFGKKPLPNLYAAGQAFEAGKALTLARGSDVTFIATGEMVWRAMQARELLQARGLSCGVISMHTIKPLDTAAVIEAGKTSRAVVTVEEHSVCGGLGEACAAALMQAGVCPAMNIAAVADEYTVSGSQSEILAHYGLEADGLAARAEALLRR